MLNGEPREVAAQTLADLVTELGYTDMPVATAKNGTVVRKKIATRPRYRTGMWSKSWFPCREAEHARQGPLLR